MIFRLSQKLARKVKMPELSVLPEADDPLTDWSAHLFNVSRTQYLYVCNTRSLYGTVIFARGINDVHPFIIDAMRGIADEMEQDGLSKAYDERIANAKGPMLFAKAISRSVTGSMNDLISMAKWHLRDDTVAPSDLGRWLNKAPLSMLSQPGKPGFAFPRHVMKHLIAIGG